MHFVFDYETTGFPNKFLPPGDKNQARVVQAAGALFDDSFDLVNSFCFIIRPDGWTISQDAQKVHGKSMELCQRYGVSGKAVNKIIVDNISAASKVICHNIKFEIDLTNIECNVHGNIAAIGDKGVCTMLAMTPLCKLPSKVPGKYKWPRLKEAYSYIFHKEPDNQHDALGDIKATFEIYRWLVDKGHLAR